MILQNIFQIIRMSKKFFGVFMVKSLKTFNIIMSSFCVLTFWYNSVSVKKNIDNVQIRCNGRDFFYANVGDKMSVTVDGETRILPFHMNTNCLPCILQPTFAFVFAKAIAAGVAAAAAGTSFAAGFMSVFANIIGLTLGGAAAGGASVAAPIGAGALEATLGGAGELAAIMAEADAAFLASGAAAAVAILTPVLIAAGITAGLT